MTIYIYTAFLLTSVIISAYSQILLKKAALKTYKNIIFEYLNPYVIFGYGIFFAAIVLDMIGLQKVPVSYIPVIESSSYFFVIIFSRIFLNEKINKKQVIAFLLIFSGIAIYLI